jgi:hypothetical protein
MTEKSTPGDRTGTETCRSDRRADRRQLRHPSNTALTGLTYDIDGGQQFVRA